MAAQAPDITTSSVPPASTATENTKTASNALGRVWSFISELPKKVVSTIHKVASSAQGLYESASFARGAVMLAEGNGGLENSRFLGTVPVVLGSYLALSDAAEVVGSAKYLIGSKGSSELGKDVENKNWMTVFGKFCWAVANTCVSISWLADHGVDFFANISNRIGLTGLASQLGVTLEKFTEGTVLVASGIDLLGVMGKASDGSFKFSDALGVAKQVAQTAFVILGNSVAVPVQAGLAMTAAGFGLAKVVVEENG